MFGTSPIAIGGVGHCRAGHETERRIRGIPKMDWLVNWSKFKVQGGFLWV